MKVVILAGGLGTRMREETEYRPKPMTEVGGKPLLWHIMKHFDYYGFNEFIICLGHKGDVIRDYFLNYGNRNANFTVNLKTGKVKLHDAIEEDWKVTLLETGDETPTGGRLVKALGYLPDTFMITYGDGLSDVNLAQLLDHHERSGKYATVTAVQATSRFGELGFENNTVIGFKEKLVGEDSYINGGFFVIEPEAWQYIGRGIETMPLETGLLAMLTEDRQLNAYKHDGFWTCIDTYRELQQINDMYNKGNTPWITWQEEVNVFGE